MSQVDKFELSDDAYAQRTGEIVNAEGDASLIFNQTLYLLTNSGTRLADLLRKQKKRLYRSHVQMSRSGRGVRSNLRNKISTNVALFDLWGPQNLAKEPGSALNTMSLLARTMDRE